MVPTKTQPLTDLAIGSDSDARLVAVRAPTLHRSQHALRCGPDERLPTWRAAREAFDRLYLEEVLRRVAGNVSAAARICGRNRTDLYDVFRRYRIDPAAFRPVRGSGAGVQAAQALCVPEPDPLADPSMDAPCVQEECP